MLAHARRILGLNAREEIRMVADLSQLHQQVQVILLLIFRGIPVLQQIFVDLKLYLSETHIDMHFLLGRQILLNFKLSPPQHEWLEYLVQLSDHLYVLLLDLLLVLQLLVAGGVEPVVEELGVAEDLG